MATLLIVLLASTALSLIMAFRRKPLAGQRVFRYSTPTIWILFIGAVMVTAFVGSVFRRMSLEGPLDAFDWMTLISVASIDVMFAGAAIYTGCFSIFVGADEIAVHGFLSGERRILFANLDRVEIIQGAKSQELSVFDRSGKKVFNVGATLQGFGDFVNLLETKAPDFRISVRYLDRFGKWT